MKILLKTYEQAKQEQANASIIHAWLTTQLCTIREIVTTVKDIPYVAGQPLPEALRLDPDFREAWKAERAAFVQLQLANKYVVKHFKKEEKEAREKRRAAFTYAH